MKTEYLSIAKKGLDVVNFARGLQATDHVIFFHNDLKDCRQLLFTFLKAGMDKGEAAIYVTEQEMPKQNQKATDEFSVNVKRYEMVSALKVINYDEWYLTNGKVDITNIMNLWRKAVNEAKERGFKGVRVCSEMSWAFRRNLLNDIVEYEKACDKKLEIPITTTCAYDLNMLNSLGEKPFLDLLKAHSHIIFDEPDLGFSIIVEAIDDILEKVLGELSKIVLLSSLRNLFGLEKEEIPKRFMDFRVALEKTFGATTAGLLENMIFRELYLRLKKRSIYTALEVEE